MYSFDRHTRKPWEPDPYGLDYERLMNPNPSMEGFQFAQNPATPMTPPSMGLGSGGAPATPNFMQFSAGGAGPGAPKMGGGMSGAGLASMGAGLANSMAKEEASMPQAQAGKGSPIQDTMLNWEFWDALNEMQQNKRRR